MLEEKIREEITELVEIHRHIAQNDEGEEQYAGMLHKAFTTIVAQAKARGAQQMKEKCIAVIKALGIVDTEGDGLQFIKLTHNEVIDAISSLPVID